MELRHYDAIGEKTWVEVLENGLTVYVVPKKGFFKSVAMFATNYGGSDVRFRLNGQWHDTPAGIAHFLEHKMFDTADGNALAKLSESGASPNAFTSSGRTAYHFESTEKFEDNLRVLLDFVSVPYFTQESVQKEQGIIGQEIRMTEDDPDFMVYQNLMRALYATNPIRDSVAGTVESIAKISAQTLYNCHAAFYVPSNMVLCVSGDVEPGHVCDIAREILPKERKEVAWRDYGPEESREPALKRLAVNMEVAVPLFMLGVKLRGGLTGRERMKQEIVGDFTMNLLTGKSSLLYAKLYSDGLVNQNFFCGTDFFPAGATALVGGESRDPDAVSRAIAQAAAEFAVKGPDPDLFERLRRAAFGTTLRGLDSPYGICSGRMEGHFSQFDPFESADVIRSATLGDVREFAAEYLLGERIAVSVVEPKGAN